MRYRFWSFVHDQLERAWHWVYYNKLHDPKELQKIVPSNIVYDWQYSVTYVNGRGALVAFDPESTENEQGDTR